MKISILTTVIALTLAVILLRTSYMLGENGYEWFSDLLMTISTSVVAVYLTVLLVDETRKRDALKANAIRLGSATLGIEYSFAPLIKHLLYHTFPDIASRWWLVAADESEDAQESQNYALFITEAGKRLIDHDLSAVIDRLSNVELKNISKLLDSSCKHLDDEIKQNSFDPYSSDFTEELITLLRLARNTQAKIEILINSRIRVKRGNLKKSRAFSSESVAKDLERFINEYYTFRDYRLAALEKYISKTPKDLEKKVSS